MKILFDETGDFALKRIGDICIVTLVSIPEYEGKVVNDLFSKIQKESNGRTIKGKTISFKNRCAILKLIKDLPAIKYTTYLSSKVLNPDNAVSSFKDAQIKKLESSIELPRQINNMSLVSDLELLRNQMKNLALADFTKFIFTSNLLKEWQQVFPFDYLNYSDQSENWDCRFILDSLNKPEKMKRLVKSFMMLTTNSRNPNYKCFLPKEWPKSHPFIKRYDITEGFNAKKFFEKFDYLTEEKEPLLILPDIIGNNMLKALREPENLAYVELLKMIKGNRSVSMTLKNKKNYFIVTGLDSSKKRDAVDTNIRRLHRNLNFSLSDLIET